MSKSEAAVVFNTAAPRINILVQSLRRSFETGAFDIIAEFLPHVTIILYRVYPNSHAFLRRLFLAAMATTLCGTITETIVTMYMFGSLWNRWTLAFKITTPMLHVLFAAAQLWGTWNFYCLYQKQCRLLVAGRDHDDLAVEEAKPAGGHQADPGSVWHADAPERIQVE